MSLSAKYLQLEIEKQALGREEDDKAKEHLADIEKENSRPARELLLR